LRYGSTYRWFVNVTDGMHWSNITLQFTTISQAPQITNITPADGSINIPISLSELRFTLIDYQNDKVNYTITANPDIIGGIQTGNNIINGTTIHIPITTTLNYGTIYHWRVNCTDGKEWTNKSYTFTTKSSFDFPLKWTINTGGWEERGLRLADINGDGAEEIFFHSAKIDGTGPKFIRAYNGIDGSEIWTYYDTNISDIYGPGRMEVVDLNNDDIPEVVFSTVDHSRPSNQNRCGMVALHGNNGTIYWKISGLDGPDSAGNPVIFDLDLDGYPTIFTATRNYGGTTQPAIYSLTYDGKINCKSNLINIVCAGGLALMDYNNDGHFEVYAGDWYDPGQDPIHPEAYGVVRAFYAENLTTIWSSSLIGNPDYILGPAAMIPILADANGDGIREVITQVYQNGSGHPRIGYAVLSAEDGKILDLYILRGSAGTQEPAVYDIDNDGHNELIMVGHEESPRSFTVFDLITKTIDFQIGVNSGSWMHPTIADVTGDGTMEILVPDSNRILIYNKTYSMIKQLNLVVGGEFTSIFMDDVDGDGLVEIVVSATTHIQVFDTDAPVPTGGIRSGLERFSEYRTGVAEYVSILGLKEEYPPRNTVGVSLNPTLSVNVTNYQYQLMNITFRTNASGSWQDVTSYTNVGNNRYTATPTNMNINSETYYWSVNATDRINTWTNMTYKFTTFTEYPVLSHVYPGNNLVGVPLNPTLSVFVEDQQSDELSVSFMTNKSGSWQPIGSTQTGYNNTYIQSIT
ncbi:MAG: VCBS repeat-containing protein, partial [Thermoplasmata archaeon]|nr:VCBS repeat-containing protein [Thermoplasmata archaeon]